MALPSLAAQYRSALPGYHFAFPRDHFSHPDFQTEWWYYTGNLKSADGRRFGFELTFFRQAVTRDPGSGTIRALIVIETLSIEITEREMRKIEVTHVPSGGLRRTAIHRLAEKR